MITGTKTFSGILVLALFSAVIFVPAHAQTANKISAQEAHDIAVDAYVSFYPLVTMDVTRKQLTNVAPAPGVFGGPMNMFITIQAFPPEDFRGVLRPNFDTLYSNLYLDL